MKTTKIILLAMLISYGLNTIAQVAINNDGSSPDASAVLDVKSTDKGMLVPRMTQTEISNIVNPVDGLIVYSISDSHLYTYNESAGEWKEIAIGTGTITPTPLWTCGDALVDARDSQLYNTVLIGTQCWMAENLNIGTMINSTSGGTNGDGEQTDNSTTEKYCYYNNTSNCDIYGGLYQWNEIMQYVASGAGIQGICSDGWHLPTDDEWKTMEMALGLSQSEADDTGWRGTDEGEKMKSTSGWNTNGNGTNSSGFNALPGGYRSSNGSFYNLGNSGYWWSSSETSGTNAWYRHLYYDNDQVYRGSYVKTYGFSVRCLKD